MNIKQIQHFSLACCTTYEMWTTPPNVQHTGMHFFTGNVSVMILWGRSWTWQLEGLHRRQKPHCSPEKEATVISQYPSSAMKYAHIGALPQNIFIKVSSLFILSLVIFHLCGTHCSLLESHGKITRLDINNMGEKQQKNKSAIPIKWIYCHLTKGKISEEFPLHKSTIQL